MTTKAEKRNITKEDILLEARLLSEGVRIEVKKLPEKMFILRGEAHEEVETIPNIAFDGCEIVSHLMPNPYSRMEAIIDGENVTISDMGKLLVTATFEERPDWRYMPMGNGDHVESVFSGSADLFNIVLNFRCYNFDSGRGCGYCGIYASTKSAPAMPASEAREITARQVEAAVIAIQNGCRSTMLLTGGVLPPEQRGQMTDGIERVMTQFRESLDEETLSQLHIAANTYPPDDFSEMYKWKDLGINATAFDFEIMDPAYWKAICPEKSEAYSRDFWKEAQAASVEVFGRGRGTTTGIVMGLEPMAGLLEGVEERISKGVFTQLFGWRPFPDSPYAGMMPPSAPWFVEAAEKIADIYLRYADTFDVDLTEDTRFGYTRKGRSFYISIVDDEMSRRLQEMGKLGPGLPRQGAIEPA